MAAASVGLSTTSSGIASAPRAVRRQRRAWHLLVRNRMAMIGAAIVVTWVLLAALAPLIAPYDPSDQEVRQRLAGPSPARLLGVDELGRDVLSRVLYGGRVSLPVAAVVVLLAATFGTLYGCLAGFGNKWLDEGAMRLVDM